LFSVELEFAAAPTQYQNRGGSTYAKQASH
jgi:hypothetical protein